jgi:hypothetical protein
MAFEKVVKNINIPKKKFEGLPWKGFSGDVMGKGLEFLNLEFGFCI